MAARPGSERDHQIAEEQAALRRGGGPGGPGGPPGGGVGPGTPGGGGGAGGRPARAGPEGPRGAGSGGAARGAPRRVATMVARAAPPEEIFAAVSAEAGRVLGADFTFLSRYDADNAATIVASWSGASAAFPAGTRVNLGGRNIHTLVFQTGQAAR